MIQNSLENPIVLDVNISSIALFRHTHTGCRYDLQAVSSANLRIIQRVREALAKGVVSDNTLLGMLLLTVEVFPRLRGPAVKRHNQSVLRRHYWRLLNSGYSSGR